MKRDKIQLRTRLDNLLSKLCEVLRDLPGACGLCLFGSLAEGKGDQYSDIDIKVATTNFSASVASRHIVLERVSPIEIDWSIAYSPSEWASTFLFQGESYYHKVDIGLVAASQVYDVLATLQGKGSVIWEGASTVIQLSKTSTNAYIPEPGTPGHFLIGQLLGAIRYVKARKRGQHLTCWRFASAVADWLASVLYEQSKEWMSLGRKLNSWEYVELDSILDASEREEFLGALDFSTPTVMDGNLYRLLNRMAALIEIKAKVIGDIIPRASTQRLLSFIKTELSIDSE